MADRVEDVRPGPGRLPPDLIVAAVQDARPGSRWRKRDVGAAAILVLAVAAALVLPAFLFARGLRETQTIRGVGAGRGVFTAAVCGDPKTTVSTDSDGNQTTHVSYTCTGAFHSRTASLDDVAVESDVDYHAGWRTAAYVTGTDHVRLASNREAAPRMALWFTLVCLITAIEAAAVWLLYRRLRRRTRTGAGIGLEEVVLSGVLFVLVGGPILVLYWLASYLILMAVYAA